jgi:NAD(P)-dependent dehydrogenase (short-subunit alcohol dehydrogenase family)
MVLVTGGTHGIGRACVERLARDGHRVAFTGRDRTAGAAVEHTISGTTFVYGDVALEADCQRVVETALNMCDGRLDGLVNNAGMSSREAFAQSSAADWDGLMAVNARSAFLFMRFALQGLIAAKGAVVNISSIAGKVGEEGLAIYCASKAAMIALTQALALEFGASIRINAVCPGQVDTRMMSGITANPKARQQLELRIPAGRFAAPVEIANVVAWLLSSEASYVNGAVITADGGETAGVRLPRTDT